MNEESLMNIRKGSLSYWVLLSLETVAKNSSILENFTYSGQMRAIKGINTQPSKKTLAETIRRLRLKGMVECERQQDGQIVLKLTSLGREFLDAKNDTVNDGKYRIIIWDIPESKRTIRNLLRRRLKDWGFVSLQRSVWVSQINVTFQLRKLIADLGIEKWVIVIESDDPTLQSLFGFH